MTDKDLNPELEGDDLGDARMAAELAPYIVDGKFSIEAYNAAHPGSRVYGSLEELIAEIEAEAQDESDEYFDLANFIAGNEAQDDEEADE